MQQRSAISRFGHVSGSTSAQDIADNSANIETNTQSIQTLQTDVTQLNNAVETKRIDLGSYSGQLYGLQPTEWVTLVNATAAMVLYIHKTQLQQEELPRVIQ